MLQCKQCLKRKKCKYGNISLMNGIVILGYCIHLFGSLHFGTPMSNFECAMQLSKALHMQLCLPKLFQQGSCPF